MIIIYWYVNNSQTLKRDPGLCTENIYEFVHPFESEYPENFYEITPDGHNPNTLQEDQRKLIMSRRIKIISILLALVGVLTVITSIILILKKDEMPLEKPRPQILNVTFVPTTGFETTTKSSSIARNCTKGSKECAATTFCNMDTIIKGTHVHYGTCQSRFKFRREKTIVDILCEITRYFYHD